MTQPPQSELAPLPTPDERSKPYWEALGRGELLLHHCAVCGGFSHPAATECRACGSPQLAWRAVEPRGRLFSWAVENRAIIPGIKPPYVIAQVTPDCCAEGDVRLACTLLVNDPSGLELGIPVKMVTAPVPGSSVTLAHFTPA